MLNTLYLSRIISETSQYHEDPHYRLVQWSAFYSEMKEDMLFLDIYDYIFIHNFQSEYDEIPTDEIPTFTTAGIQKYLFPISIDVIKNDYHIINGQLDDIRNKFIDIWGDVSLFGFEEEDEDNFDECSLEYLASWDLIMNTNILDKNRCARIIMYQKEHYEKLLATNKEITFWASVKDVLEYCKHS